MTGKCTICAHPKRGQIDKLLVAGKPDAEVARKFTLGAKSVGRHRSEHLPTALAQAAQQDKDARDFDVLSEAKNLHARAMDILDEAEDDKTKLGAIREARGVLELLGKLLGDIDDRPQVNVLIAPQWAAMRAVIQEALVPFPDARQAVAAALLRADNAILSQ